MLLNKKILLLTTQPFVEERLWKKKDRKLFIKNILIAMGCLKDKYVLIIKLHPQENISTYKKLLGKNLSNIILVKDEIDTPTLIYNSDLLLTVSSTTALEAMILDKPVIIFDFNNSPGVTYYINSKAVLIANNVDTLIKSVKLVFDPQMSKKLKKSRNEFVYNQAYIQDGAASARIVNEIVRLIRGT